MQFDYYYGAEADQFNFIKVPKAMIKDSAFASLSLASKLLYGLLLDRMNLSMKNKWLDDENRVYIIYQITEIMEDLGASKKKAIEYLQELEKFGLVEKRRRGFGLPNYLYVKNFSRNDTNFLMGVSNIIRGTQTDTSRGANIDTSGVGDMTPLEVSSGVPQNNKKNNNININKTNPILNLNECRVEDRMDEIYIYEEYLSEKLEVELLCERYPSDKDMVRGMYDLALEIMLCKNDTVQIAGNEFPTQIVKSRFMKLDSSHIEYVLSCLKSNTTKIGNIKKYLLTSLFNAPATMHSFYQAEFNHDMPEYVTLRK